MLTLSKEKTESRQDSPSTEFVVRKWLVVFGSLFNREITPFLIGSWCELLAHLSPEQAEQGCREIARTWTFNHFPTPGAVLSQFNKAEEKGFRLESEKEWEKLLAWVSENVFPDSPGLIRKGASRLSPEIEHAARAAGGLRFLESCTREQLIWAKKDFLAALANVRETGQSQHLIGNGEAKKILARLSAPVVLNVKQLPPEPEAPLPPKSEVRKVLDKIAELPSEEEWQARKDDQKRRLASWLVQHPEHTGAKP